MSEKHSPRHLYAAEVLTCYLFCTFCMIRDYYVLIIKEMSAHQVAFSLQNP